jgi:hypothetical protein
MRRSAQGSEGLVAAGRRRSLAAVEEFWIILGSVAGVVTALVTIWLVVLARRSSSAPAPSTGPGADEAEVKIEVANLFETYDDPPDLGPWSFSVTGINRSDHPIRFTSAGFERADGKQIVIRDQPYGSNLIGTIPPHDSGETWIECAALEQAGLDVYGPIVGWARTATGELYKSEPRVLRSD